MIDLIDEPTTPSTDGEDSAVEEAGASKEANDGKQVPTDADAADADTASDDE